MSRGPRLVDRHDEDAEELTHELKVHAELERERTRRAARRQLDAEERGPVAALQAVPATDLIPAPAPLEIVEAIAWAGCVTCFVSESGAGKTFVLLDLAAAIGAGLTWHGRSVRQGSVVYCGYEGDALSVRLRALRDVHGYRLEHLYVLRASDPLSPHLSRDGNEERSLGELKLTAAVQTLSADLASAGRPPIRVLMIDTVRASMTGSEDGSDSVAAYLRAIRRVLSALPDAGGVLAHHAGWQDGDAPRKRERGSSAWRGNSDATLYLEAGEYDPTTGEAALVIRTLKVRDAERANPLHVIRRRVELAESLGDDLRRGPRTSCVIVRDTRTREDREAEDTRTADAARLTTDRAVLRVLRDHPEASSQRLVRAHAGLSSTVVADSLARILRQGWAVPPARQRQPYTLTSAGSSALEVTT